jgi:isocitrate dehydrogenase (NAD+)
VLEAVEGGVMRKTVCLIAGDGIGPEVTRAARRVIDATGVAIDWLDTPAGLTAEKEFGSLLPDETIAAIEKHRLALKGPLTTPVREGHPSINVRLRKRFNLYAAVRPIRSLAGIRTRYENVEIVVIRENTEGLYSGLEHEIVPGVVESIKVATRVGCERIARFAFDYAGKRGRGKVTVFHKANIMKLSDGLFLECARRIHRETGEAVPYEELIIDNGCMQLVRDPARFDILLLENLYGDVVSDLCAGLVGGLGVVPGANIGDDCAIFEAVHGSAPDIAGQGIANPLAILMSGVMMLNHIGETGAAERIKTAYDAVLKEGQPGELTPDIGGRGTTEGFADAVMRRMG